MSAVLVRLPESRRGRRSADQERAYQTELDQFAASVLEINSRLEFQVSSRGWCYILEEHGLKKGDFDKAQRLLNDCRKTGRLPLDICAEDDARALTGVVEEEIDEATPDEFAMDAMDSAQETIDSAHDDARATCTTYTPHGWNEGLDYQLVCMVEKVDLVSLFEPICRKYRVPIANAKGWSDLHLRASIMRYFCVGEDDGRIPVLLYAGDHDPAGLLISKTLPKLFADLSRAVDWAPDNLIVDRFGLNEDFISAHGLSWIENLQTGSGSDLSDPEHHSHDRAYVQEYISRFGVRKVEANALVVRPEAGRRLIADAIAQYIPADWPVQFKERNREAREAALAEFDLLREQL